MPDFLQQDIKFLTGVGPKRAELLNKELEIFTFEDLLYYFPYKYIDRSRFYQVRDLNPELPHIQLKGKIIGFEYIGGGRKKRLVAYFTDGTGTIELVWFRGLNYIQKSLELNKEYIVFGKPGYFGGKYNVIHPEIEDSIRNQNVIKAKLQAHYSTTEKLKKNYLPSRAILKLVNNLLLQLKDKIHETFPEYLIQKYKLISLPDALFNIHFPQNAEILKKAIYRLKFEELFYIQLNILQKRSIRLNKFNGFVFSKVGDYLHQFYEKNLPFELTNAQKRVLKEIRKDVGSGKQMNRLLQGDVGSGKTLVALMSMLIALDNDFQACLMAPTEILASQHFKSISKFLEGLDIQIEILTGSSKKPDRERIHAGLLEGSLKILVGTHALLEDVVQFRRLGLVIIDEQHRFGVAQRARLWQKSKVLPHILVMTATPIPRTLSMTLYGDMDVSVIDELPPGRKPVSTKVISPGRLPGVYDFLNKEMNADRQIYVVYPLIQGSEKMDLQAAEQGLEDLKKIFPDKNLALLHGKTRKDDKTRIMKAFAYNEIQLLVSTTVIEVGINVPNASVMLIENAERFGLSQLHQLRGRVGRGADKSWCILLRRGGGE